MTKERLFWFINKKERRWHGKTFNNRWDEFTFSNVFRYAANGKAIQATLGFVGAFIRIIEKVNPTHIVVLFDGEHPNDRTELFAEYKANRTDYSKVPDYESPFSQLRDVYDALTFMNIRHVEVAELETDDVIASYVHSFQNECQIVIASFDSDFFSTDK